MITAVVILNWNGIELLKTFLPSVCQFQEENTEIWLADNGSTDESVEWVKNNFSQVKIHLNDKNYGFSEGYNQALSHICADYYILLNSDVEVTQNWVKPLVERFDSEPNLGVIQPNLLDYKDKTKYEYAGAAGGFMDLLGFMACRGRIFDKLETINSDYNYNNQLFWASGAAFGIRAKLYHQLGGLDKDLFAHMEEIDLCWRVQRAGYKIACEPKSKVYHLGGGTLSAQSSKKIELNFRNNHVILFKNHSLLNWIIIEWIRQYLDIIAVMKFVVEGKFDFAFGVIKGILKFWFGLPTWIKNKLQDAKKIKDAKRGKSFVRGIFKGSFLIEHFLSKKNKYSELDHSKFTSKP